jgi:hypothetical protein
MNLSTIALVSVGEFSMLIQPGVYFAARGIRFPGLGKNVPATVKVKSLQKW